MVPTFFLMLVILGAIRFLNAAPVAERVNRHPRVWPSVRWWRWAIWFGRPTSGAPMNPARSLPPALFAVEPLQLPWILQYWPCRRALLADLIGRRSQNT